MDKLLTDENDKTAQEGQGGNHPLENLTPELLLMIGAHLPIEGRLCLHLTSKIISQKLRSEYLDKAAQEFGPLVRKVSSRDNFLRVPTPDGKPWYWSPRDDFLLLLSRDFRNQIYCYFCQKIHHPNLSDHTTGRILSCATQNSYSAQFYGRKFTFSRACMAMKCHRMGFERARDYHLTDLAPQSRRTSVQYGFHREIRKKVENDRLKIRVIYRKLIGLPTQMVAGRQRFDFQICSHFRARSVESGGVSVWSSPMICVWARRHPISTSIPYWPLENNSFECPLCSTVAEMFIDTTSNEAGHVLTIVALQDLGECITPFDPSWYSKFQDVTRLGTPWGGQWVNYAVILPTWSRILRSHARQVPQQPVIQESPEPQQILSLRDIWSKCLYIKQRILSSLFISEVILVLILVFVWVLYQRLPRPWQYWIAD